MDTSRHRAREFVSGRTLEVGGLPIRFRASDLARAEAMAVVIGALPRSPATPRVEWIFGDDAPDLPSDPPTESHDLLRVWRGGEVLALSYDGCVSAIATRSGVVQGGSEGDFFEAWRYVFHYALPHVLGLHDRYVLHAGALVRDEDAVLLFGDSGAGKSTLVLAALDSGWRALSDDLVVVRQGPAGPEASGIGKPFRVPGDVLRPDPTEDRQPISDARERWTVGDHAWEQGWFPIRGSIAVGHGRGPRAELDALPAHESVTLLLGAFVALTEPTLARRWLPIAADVGRRGSWTLRHASDASVRLEQAALMLDRIGGVGS